MRAAGVVSWTRSTVLGAALLLALVFGAVAGAGLDHGQLDPTFTDLHGRAVTSFGAGDDAAGAIWLQSDGKIVAAGQSSNGADDDFALSRYRTDGSLDPGFGVDGKVTTPIGPGDDRAHAIVQKDGKTVVAGTSFNGSNDDFALVRYNADGSLDTTFDGDGKVTTPIGSGDDRAYALALQSDGKLVVAGTSSNGSNDDFALVRYNADGSLDTTFDGDGKVTTPIGPGDDRAYGLAIEQGKLVAAGASWNGSDDDFAVARYNADGSPDTTFDGDGNVTTPVGPGADAAHAVTILNDKSGKKGKNEKSDKIIVAGSSSNGSDDDFALVGYNDQGLLDTSFRGNGKVTASIGPGDDDAFAIVQLDGKLTVAGSSWNGTNYDFALARFTKNGGLDNGYSSDGKVTTPINPGDDARAYALVSDKDGRLAAAGYASNGSSDDFAVARYKSNGALDVFTSWPGVVTTPFGAGDDVARALDVSSSGRPVVAGSSWNGSDYDFALVRYLSDGSLDTSFGTGGKVTTPIGPGDDEAYALALQGTKLVAAGSSWNGSSYDFAVARYNADGSPDASFNGNGVVTTPIGSGDDVAYAVVVQADGKIVVAGFSQSGSQDGFALARYNQNGSLDAAFGTGGIVTTPVGFGGIARSLVLQPDGKLLAAGMASNGSDTDFELVRYTTSGTLDVTFGTGGMVMTAIGPGNDAAYALDLQKGKPTAAGSSWNGSDDDFALVRYNANGTPDTSFGGDGKVTTAIGSGNDEAYAIGQQKNGKLIAAGASWNGVDDDFALVRYETDGSLNTTFGSGGRVTTSLGAGNDEIRAAAVQATTVVAAGGGFNGSDEDFALSRYVLCAGKVC